jgi:hypothetical protein
MPNCGVIVPVPAQLVHPLVAANPVGVVLLRLISQLAHRCVGHHPALEPSHLGDHIVGGFADPGD